MLIPIYVEPPRKLSSQSNRRGLPPPSGHSVLDDPKRILPELIVQEFGCGG